MPEDDDPPGREIRFLVSAKHMILASPVFKAMLQPNNFIEGRALAEGGKAEVPFPDDDPIAFRLLLQIIHNRTRELPRQISLQLLSDFTILVDKYRMVEAVEIFVQWWVVDLRSSLPTCFGDTVIPWLTISWVFQLPQEFKGMTRLLQRGSHEDLHLQMEDYPIPTLILGMLHVR